MPLVPRRQRKPSISSLSDEEADPISTPLFTLELSAIIDEQKKTIRRLNLKLSKL